MKINLHRGNDLRFFSTLVTCNCEHTELGANSQTPSLCEFQVSGSCFVDNCSLNSRERHSTVDEGDLLAIEIWNYKLGSSIEIQCVWLSRDELSCAIVLISNCVNDEPFHLPVCSIMYHCWTHSDMQCLRRFWLLPVSRRRFKCLELKRYIISESNRHCPRHESTAGVCFWGTICLIIYVIP